MSGNAPAWTTLTTARALSNSTTEPGLVFGAASIATAINPPWTATLFTTLP